MPITPAIASPNWWANSTSRIQSVFFDSRMITASFFPLACFRVFVLLVDLCILSMDVSGVLSLRQA